MASRSEEAHELIRRRIIRCEMEPGSAFTETQASRSLGIGRTPVREALARLTREGLVVCAPRAGYRVAELTLGDVIEIYDLREPLEGKAAELATRRVNEAAIAELQALCDVPFAAEAEGLEAFLGANTRFHAVIGRLSGNGRLARALDDMTSQLERLYWLGVPRSPRTLDMLGEHRQLVAALAERDPRRARQLAERHCRTSRKVTIDALLQSGAMARASLTPPAQDVGEAQPA